MSLEDWVFAVVVLVFAATWGVIVWNGYRLSKDRLAGKSNSSGTSESP